MFIGLHIFSNLLKKEKSGNYLFPKPLSQNLWVSCTLAWDINAYTGVYRYSLCSFPSVLFYVFHHGTSGTESSSFSQSAGNYLSLYKFADEAQISIAPKFAWWASFLFSVQCQLPCLGLNINNLPERCS